jgi:hypothetical protein
MTRGLRLGPVGLGTVISHAIENQRPSVPEGSLETLCDRS